MLIIIIMSPFKRICVFEHSVITNFNCACPARGAKDLGFCLKVPLDSLLVWASSGGSGETARMRRLAWTFAARIGDKYQIRLTRLIIIIITLFQEDNIFGMYASLTYGPQLQRYPCHWQLNRHKLFTVCTEQVRSPYTEHAASRLPNPTSLEGRYDLSRLKTNRWLSDVVRE